MSDDSKKLMRDRNWKGENKYKKKKKTKENGLEGCGCDDGLRGFGPIQTIIANLWDGRAPPLHHLYFARECPRRDLE